MRYDYENLNHTRIGEIIREFIDSVSKTDEQIETEGREEIETTTHLKIFVAENSGVSIGNLEKRIEELVSSGGLTKNRREYFAEKNIREASLNNNASYVEIGTPKFDRVDQFVFVEDENHMRIFTTERKHWTEKTVEKLIDYLPELDRLFLTSEDIDEIVRNLDTATDTRISGFTARYQPYYEDKSVTIQFHGGSEDDLEDVREEFNARPSRLEFSQKNSPYNAVKGTVKQDGYISIPQVKEGSEGIGVETTQDVSLTYERKDQNNFEVEYQPTPVTPGQNHFLSAPDDEGVSGDGGATATEGDLTIPYAEADQGRSIEGFTAVTLEESIEEEDADVDLSENTLICQLEKRILAYKRRYRYSSWEPGHYTVYDSIREESLEITIEGSDINLHAKSDTTASTFRDFYQLIDEKFNTTYLVNKKSERISA